MRNGIVAIGLLAAVTVSACGEAGGAEVPASEPTRTVNVEVVEVQPRPFTNVVRIVGTVEADRDVTVSAEEGGRVEALLAAKGSRLRAGAPLVRINDDVLSAQLEQAASQAALAEETWERQKRLWEQDSVGTEIAYLQARYNAATAKAQARVLRERVARTVVRAPISGVLDDRMVEVGSMVAPGAPVARILDADTVKVVGGVPERFAEDISRGAAVTVTVDALGGRSFAGAIDFVGAAINGDNRTFQVEVMVPNPGLGIKPGMVANVQIARQAVDSALVVPRNAVLRREAGYILYVARQSGEEWRAEARPVTPGATRGEQVVIEQGLEAGERVVVVGQQQLADGDAIRLLSQPEPREVRGQGRDQGSGDGAKEDDAAPDAEGGEG